VNAKIYFKSRLIFIFMFVCALGTPGLLMAQSDGIVKEREQNEFALFGAQVRESKVSFYAEFELLRLDAKKPEYANVPVDGVEVVIRKDKKPYTTIVLYEEGTYIDNADHKTVRRYEKVTILVPDKDDKKVWEKWVESIVAMNKERENAYEQKKRRVLPTGPE